MRYFWRVKQFDGKWSPWFECDWGDFDYYSRKSPIVETRKRHSHAK